MLIRAAFKFRNILILAAGIVLTAGASSYVPDVSWLPLLAGAAGTAAYTAGVVGTLKSADFKREVELSEKLDDISRLDRECSRLYKNVYSRLGRDLRIKVGRVMKQKAELLRCFDDHIEDPMKQRIIQQALKLVMAYIRLAGNYADRMRELSRQNLNELVHRINVNNRKLGSLKSYQAVLELTKTIEMDERLLQSLKDERKELEMTNVRLDQIESSIVGFKHRILSSDTSDPETEEIENAINEATALDNALNEHRRFRQQGRL
jgi:hypothetical protein